MLVPLIALLQLAPPAGSALQAGIPASTIEYSGRRGELDVMVPRMDQDVVIDGVLDEAAWAEAAVLTGFSQYRPVDGVAAEDDTEVFVWYSSTASTLLSRRMSRTERCGPLLPIATGA